MALGRGKVECNRKRRLVGNTGVGCLAVDDDHSGERALSVGGVGADVVGVTGWDVRDRKRRDLCGAIAGSNQLSHGGVGVV